MLGTAYCGEPTKLGSASAVSMNAPCQIGPTPGLRGGAFHRAPKPVAQSAQTGEDKIAVVINLATSVQKALFRRAERSNFQSH
jgi:hypothetical protein